MSITEQIIMIAMVVLGTMATRFLPFIVFPHGKETPKYVQYLGKALPGAVFGLLVVYSLKSVSLIAYPHGIPEFIALAFVETPDAFVHRRRDGALYGFSANSLLKRLK